jgi:hypothetical protein
MVKGAGGLMESNTLFSPPSGRGGKKGRGGVGKRILGPGLQGWRGCHRGACGHSGNRIEDTGEKLPRQNQARIRPTAFRKALTQELPRRKVRPSPRGEGASV